jgi:hypothetical protein
MSEFTRAINIMMLIGITIFATAFVGLPALLQVPRTYNGEVTSTATQNYLVQTTSINFKDGSAITVWGIYNIPIGNHTFHTTSSWAMVDSLKQIDGVNQ